MCLQFKALNDLTTLFFLKAVVVADFSASLPLINLCANFCGEAVH